MVGGDGYCGFPLALRLSSLGHDVLIIDNFSRRRIDVANGFKSLVPIAEMSERLEAWREVSGRSIEFAEIDVSLEENFVALCQLFQRFRPTSVVHLGEQRSAPYSMKNVGTKLYTTRNNIQGNHVLINVIVETDQETHYVHLGTMGVYGYGSVPDTIITEGYVKVTMAGKEVEILHPAYPGSVYHMSKTQDALLFQFYAKNYKLRITDLHQGIVWGTDTAETKQHTKLQNRLDFDSDYGTVLNRFLVQSAAGFPLTVYGTGMQTRAFIHLENSVECMTLAILHPPNRGERVKIFNQMTQTLRVTDIAHKICEWYPSTTVQHLENPRNELVENGLQVSNQQFLDIGLKPIFFDYRNINEIYERIKDNIHRVGPEDQILPVSFWK